jgi:translation initiation factor IF-2
MTKVRVYEIARDVGLPNGDLLRRLSSMGIPVRNHMSALDPLEVDRVKRALDKERQESVVEERIRPTVVRRRVTRRPGTEGVNEGERVSVVVEREVQRPEPAPVSAKSVVSKAPPASELIESRTDDIAQPAQEAPRVIEAPVNLRSAPEVDEAPPTVIEPEPPRQVEEPRPRASTPTPRPTPAPQRAAARAEQDEAPSEPPPAEERESRRGSQPPPAHERLGHAALPPGVVQRGKAMAPSVGPISAEARQRILADHAARQPGAPRRKEIGRAALGPAGRQPGRPGARPPRRKLAPGKKGKQTEITVPSAQKRVIRIEDQIQLQTLAQRMSLKATDVLMKLMQLGMANVHINSTLDADTAKILASEFGYEVENVARSTEDIVGEARGTFEDLETDRLTRPPIVTVMGHVDHGKTSLLDRIRKSDVAAGEAGGITQHIGAYRVETERGTVVFLDTPGHEAFTAMRARGANATDLVVLVVAADDGVMPQTKEAINHAKAAEVPIVVAVNKIDKPDARPEVVKNQLASEGLQPEEWGGDTIFVHASAITGQGVDQLLESILLQAEVLELRANATIPAEGVVLEAYLDRGRGPVANVLIQNGTLHAGDYVVAGGAWGRVRALTDDRGKPLRVAGPSTPVEILGLSDMPAAGERIYAVTDPKKAQDVAEAQRGPGRTASAAAAPLSLEDLATLMKAGDTLELKLVVKADVQGSIEALVKALTDLSTDKVKVNVIHTGVGGITENDVMLASASHAIIIGFNVRPAGQAANVAKTENVDIRKYSVIYEAVDEVKKAMAGLLAPTLVENELGKAEVRQTFSIPKIGTIAGSYVIEGKVVRGAKARLVRDSVQIWEGRIGSLRRVKDDVREVTLGFECGIGLEGYNDVKERDVIECYEVKEVAATL